MKAFRDYCRILWPAGLQILCLAIFLFGMEYVAEQQGVKLQNGFLRVLFILGMVIIATLLGKRILKVRLESKLKKQDISIRCAVLIAILIVSGYFIIPMEKSVNGDVLAEEQGHENGHCIYKYYDKVNAVLKKEFEWDEAHEIRVLEDQFNQRFTLNQHCSSKRIRRYIPESVTDQNIEIREYPSIWDKEAKIIIYNSTELQTATGKISLFNPNAFPADFFLAEIGGEDIKSDFVFTKASTEFTGLDTSKTYIVGVEMEDMGNSDIRVETSIDGKQTKLEIKLLESLSTKR